MMLTRIWTQDQTVLIWRAPSGTVGRVFSMSAVAGCPVCPPVRSPRALPPKRNHPVNQVRMFMR